MAAGDAAWWHMDREVNRLVVTSVMWFDEPLDAGAVRAVLRDRLLTTYPRFSQRVVESPRGVWWEDVDKDADTLIAAHLVEAKLPAPGGMPELQSFASTVVNRRLDGDRPLWQAYLLGGFRGTGAALVTRIHHCVADGIALARVLLSLTDDATSGVVTDERPVSSTPLAAVASLPGAVLGELVHPRRLASDVLDAATAAREVARLVALPPDHRTALRGALGIHKAALWSEPISLERLRRRAHAAGGTVNDVVLAGLSGALRDHVARLDGDARDIRVIVPVNVRPAEQPLPATLGNAFGLLFVAFARRHRRPRRTVAGGAPAHRGAQVVTGAARQLPLARTDRLHALPRPAAVRRGVHQQGQRRRDERARAKGAGVPRRPKTARDGGVASGVRDAGNRRLGHQLRR